MDHVGPVTLERRLRPRQARCVMPIAGGAAVLTVGAILTFALTGSVRGLDLHVVGAILMCAGAAMLVLPLLIRGRSRPRRWSARSRQDVIDEGGEPAHTEDVR